MRTRRRSPIRILAVLVPVALIAGIWLGGHPSSLPGFARNTLVADSSGRLYDEALGLIRHDYYRPVDTRRLLDTSLSAAVTSLRDRFSSYLSPSSYQDFQDSTSGRFTGIGVSIAPDRRGRGLLVTEVFARSPAQRAGLRSGDVIVAAGQSSLRGASVRAASARIRGRPGTSVRLTWLRGRQRVTRAVRRARVEVPVVQSRMETAARHKIAWVRLASFTDGAHGEVSTAVRGLLAKGAQGVVLDLRDDGGGLLNEAVLVASIFLPDGKVVTTRGRARPEHVYDATGGAIPGRIPVAVLVNGNTASASEIVTGALQDRHRATVVGTHTFGKGVFQEIERLSNGGALDITVGEYFLPSGRNLGGGGVRRGAGITPDVQARDDPGTSRDEALRAALATVAKRL